MRTIVRRAIRRCIANSFALGCCPRSWRLWLEGHEWNVPSDSAERVVFERIQRFTSRTFPAPPPGRRGSPGRLIGAA